MLRTAASLLLAGQAIASPLEARQACPGVHVFGARETTVAPGYGTSQVVVNLVLGAYSGSTSEAISYPACGGQSSCGGVAYGDSARQGTANAASAINAFNAKCPSTQLVLVGYSQGGQIFDNALCGGPDSGSSITSTASPISAAALTQIKAAIFMGDPRYVNGLPYNVGTCRAQGFAARPSGYTCGGGQGSKIQSYCDSADPYCCTGSDANTHQGYGTEYGQAALTFIKSKLSASSSGGSTGGGTTTPPTTGGGTTTPPTTGGGSSSGSCAALYGQCGGQTWQGAKCCSSGTCKASNSYYSQCL